MDERWREMTWYGLRNELFIGGAQVVPGIKVVFASSLAVFGGTLPDEVTEYTMPTPSTSYGMQKMVFIPTYLTYLTYQFLKKK